MTMKTCLRITAATTLGLGAVLATAPSALADTTTVSLKSSQHGATAASFKGGGDCSGYTGTDTLWHFVVPDLDASPNSTDPNIVSISPTFDTGSMTSSQVIQNGKGINVFSNTATAVLDATATLDGAVPDGTELVLSHTCAGSGSTTGGGGGSSTGGSTGTSTGGTTGTTSGGSTGTTSGGSTGTTSGGSTGTTSGGSTGATSGDNNGTGGGNGDNNGTGGGNGNANGDITPAVPLTVAGAPAPGTAPVVDVPVVSAPLDTTIEAAPAAPVGIAGGAAGGASAPSAAAPAAAEAGAAAAAPALPMTGAPTGLLLLTGTAAVGLGLLMMQAANARLDVLFYRGRHARPSRTLASLRQWGATAR